VGDSTPTELTIGTKTTNGYSETYSGEGDLYEVALPSSIGTTLPINSKIMLKYNQNLITYYYKGSYSYELSRVIGGTYLGGADFTSAGSNYLIGTNSDVINISIGSNELGYIQVQTPYDSYWISNLSFAIKLTYSDGSTGVSVTPGEPAFSDSQLRANIANYYISNGIENDGNRAWLVADMMSYENTYNSLKMSDTQKQSYLDMAIADIETTTLPSDVAKNIISIASLGYDPKNITTSTGKSLNAINKLTSLSFTNNEFTATDNNYAIPAILVAYLQFGNEYEYEINKIIAYCLGISDKTNGAWAAFWDPSSIDLDLTAPMMLALAPYYCSNNDVKTVLDKAKTALLNNVVPVNGLVNWDSVETTGKLAAALVALNENPSTFFGTSTDLNLIYGIRTKASSLGDGFVNYLSTRDTMSTEQGFRALMAFGNYNGYSPYNIYDFSSNILNREPAVATPYSVVINVVPNDSTVIFSSNPDYSNPISSSVEFGFAYDAAPGTYYYMVEKSGYYTKTGTITVTDKTNQIVKYVSLSTANGGGGATPVDNKLTFNVKLMEHTKTASCEDGTSKISYKKNSGLYTNKLNITSIKVAKGTNLRDAFVAILDLNNISYIEKSNGYFSSIDGIYEFDHGPYSGWMFLLNGESADNALNHYSIDENTELIFYYTDYYADEYSSDTWSSSVSQKTEIKAENEAVLSTEQINEILLSGGDISFDNGNILIDKNVLKAITATSSGNIKLSMEKISDVSKIQNWEKVKEAAKELDLSRCSIYDISLSVGDKNISYFGGNTITNKFNVNSTYTEGNFYKVLILSNGRVETKAGKCIKNEAGDKQIVLDTCHYSVFVITNESCSSFIGDVDYIFTDVTNHWAIEDIQKIFDLGLMTGTAKDKFSPDLSLPGNHVRDIFVRLGYEIENMSEKSVQRQELSYVLYNYAKQKNADISYTTSLSKIQDKKDIDTKYMDAVCWCYDKGIMKGRTLNTVNPKDYLTRAEAACILLRFMKVF